MGICKECRDEKVQVTLFDNIIWGLVVFFIICFGIYFADKISNKKGGDKCDTKIEKTKSDVRV